MDKQEQIMVGLRDVLNKQTHLNGRKMSAALKEYKSSEVHFIEYIGKNDEANVTKLADAFYMTRGAISKIATKLMHKGVIESYQRPDNKKEIYFRLTARGQTVFQTHKELHTEFMERDNAVFERLTKEQYDTICDFIETYRQHLGAEISKLNIE